jgi:DMSO/TMAO reductase YedYZ molybdopterin-dependent catalytic subunit
VQHALVSASTDLADQTGPGAGPASTRPSLAAAAGAAAAALALGIAELLGGLLPGTASLVAAVGQRVIDLQPPGAKDIVVALFGTNDKLALEIVVVLVGLAVGAGLGVVAIRRFALAAGGFAVFGVIGFAATLADPLAQPAMVALQTAIAVGLGVQSLSWMLARAGRASAGASTIRSDITDPARRSFLLQTGAIGVAAMVAGVAGRRLVEQTRSAPGDVAVTIPPALDIAAELPTGADLSPTIDGLTPIVIPNETFYRIDTALLTPTVDVADWSLRIHGMVERETTLTWDELLALPIFEQYVTIACVSNEVGGRLVGNAKWSGVRLRDVLELAGVQDGATQLVGRSVDGWTAGMPTAWVMDPSREPMIAVRMNDEPLPPAHGFPARLIVPGLYGYVSATKWLAELELTTLEGLDGYWVPKGWAKEAPILTQSRIDTPKGTVASGRVPIAGVAWAPDRGISRVEVSIDDTWHDATLSQPISDATWVQWVLPWDATAGRHTIRVRATDGNGDVQTEIRTPPAPDGARGWDVVSLNVT